MCPGPVFPGLEGSPRKSVAFDLNLSQNPCFTYLLQSWHGASSQNSLSLFSYLRIRNNSCLICNALGRREIMNVKFLSKSRVQDFVAAIRITKMIIVS